MKKLFTIIAIIFLTSCGPQKIITSTKDKFESSIVHETKSIKLGLEQDINLGNPCDSLGKLKPISYNQQSGKDRIALIVENNQLKLKIKQLADTTKCKDSIVVKYHKEIVKIPYEVKVPYKGKWFWIGWLGFITALIYIFRKYFIMLFNFAIKFIKPI